MTSSYLPEQVVKQTSFMLAAFRSWTTFHIIIFCFLPSNCLKNANLLDKGERKKPENINLNCSRISNSNLNCDRWCGGLRDITSRLEEEVAKTQCLWDSLPYTAHLIACKHHYIHGYLQNIHTSAWNGWLAWLSLHLFLWTIIGKLLYSSPRRQIKKGRKYRKGNRFQEKYAKER